MYPLLLLDISTALLLCFPIHALCVFNVAMVFIAIRYRQIIINHLIISYLSWAIFQFAMLNPQVFPGQKITIFHGQKPLKSAAEFSPPISTPRPGA
jgi:hypothetical protein